MRRASDPIIDLAERRRLRDGVTLDDIAGLRVWCAWQNEPRGRGERPTKVPYRAVGQRARPNDPATWLTRDQAERCRDALPLPCGDGGLGLMLGVDIGGERYVIGVDLDTCRDADGRFESWAAEVIERFATYCEVSPSATGAKLFGLISKPDLAPISALVGGAHGRSWKHGKGDHPAGIELHLSHRYFAVTGERLPDAPIELRQIDVAAVEWLVREVGPGFANTDKGAGKAGRSQRHDFSRSTDALIKASRLYRQGHIKCYEEMCEALRTDPDPAIRDWFETKGRTRDGYEARRIWEEITKGDPLIVELNATYALVLTGGRTAILKEGVSAEGRATWELLGVDAFRQWHANRFVPGSEAYARRMPLANFWLTHGLRRQYEGIVFVPMRETPGHYNLWRGFAVEPKRGDCSLFVDHILENVCRGDDERCHWVLGWFADLFQHPGEKCGTALTLRGRQGVGKTIVGKIIGSLLGNHYVAVSDPRYVTGRFNSHLVSAVLLHADEGFWAGDHAAEGKIKDLVTGDFHFVEFKGKEPIKIRNYVRLLVTGNPDWLVPAGMEERRFAVFDVGENRMQDHRYFAAIEKQMAEGGREALLDYLLGFDLSAVNLRQIPTTAALLDQKIASLPAEKGWLLDLLRKGRLPRGAGCSDNECPCDALFDSYVNHANRQGARRRSIETAIGGLLKKTFPTLRRGRATGSHCDDRAYVYQFPPLAECRKRFDGLIQGSIDWGSSGSGFFDIEEWEKEPLPDL